MRDRRGFNMTTSSLGALVLTLAFVTSWALLARANTYDGLPRPMGFPDAPTTAYGAFPAVYLRGINQSADCEWYGFANVNFPANIGLQCLTYLRAIILEEANQNTLKPYQRYICSRSNRVCYDKVSRAFYCFHACYYLRNSGLEIPPVTAPTPPSPSLPPPPGTPAAVLPPPPPGGSIVGQPPPATAAPRTTSAGARSRAPSVVFLAFCAAAVNLVVRL